MVHEEQQYYREDRRRAGNSADRRVQKIARDVGYAEEDLE
jgi:hypothetical protein